MGDVPPPLPPTPILDRRRSVGPQKASSLSIQLNRVSRSSFRDDDAQSPPLSASPPPSLQSRTSSSTPSPPPPRPPEYGPSDAGAQPTSGPAALPKARPPPPDSLAVSPPSSHRRRSSNVPRLNLDKVSAVDGARVASVDADAAGEPRPLSAGHAVNLSLNMLAALQLPASEAASDAAGHGHGHGHGGFGARHLSGSQTDRPTRRGSRAHRHSIHLAKPSKKEDKPSESGSWRGSGVYTSPPAPPSSPSPLVASRSAATVPSRHASATLDALLSPTANGAASQAASNAGATAAGTPLPECGDSTPSQVASSSRKLRRGLSSKFKSLFPLPRKFSTGDLAPHRAGPSSGSGGGSAISGRLSGRLTSSASGAAPDDELSPAAAALLSPRHAVSYTQNAALLDQQQVRMSGLSKRAKVVVELVETEQSYNATLVRLLKRLESMVEAAVSLSDAPPPLPAAGNADSPAAVSTDCSNFLVTARSVMRQVVSLRSESDRLIGQWTRVAQSPRRRRRTSQVSVAAPPTSSAVGGADPDASEGVKEPYPRAQADASRLFLRRFVSLTEPMREYVVGLSENQRLLTASPAATAVAAAAAATAAQALTAADPGPIDSQPQPTSSAVVSGGESSGLSSPGRDSAPGGPSVGGGAFVSNNDKLLFQLMHSPFQRLCRYPLLFASLYQQTAADHEDGPAALRCVRQCKQLIGEINERERRRRRASQFFQDNRVPDELTGAMRASATISGSPSLPMSLAAAAAVTTGGGGGDGGGGVVVAPLLPLSSSSPSVTSAATPLSPGVSASGSVHPGSQAQFIGFGREADGTASGGASSSRLSASDGGRRVAAAGNLLGPAAPPFECLHTGACHVAVRFSEFGLSDCALMESGHLWIAQDGQVYCVLLVDASAELEPDTATASKLFAFSVMTHRVWGSQKFHDHGPQRRARAHREERVSFAVELETDKQAWLAGLSGLLCRSS